MATTKRNKMRLGVVVTHSDGTEEMIPGPDSPPIAPTCASCRYKHGRTCRRNPPTLVWERGTSMWPLVEPGDWCGEHAPNRNDR